MRFVLSEEQNINEIKDLLLEEVSYLSVNTLSRR